MFANRQVRQREENSNKYSTFEDQNNDINVLSEVRPVNKVVKIKQ